MFHEILTYLTFSDIIPNLMQFSPKACLLIMSTPGNTILYIFDKKKYNIEIQ